jgi:hypothetical protein
MLPYKSLFSTLKHQFNADGLAIRAIPSRLHGNFGIEAYQ